MIFILCNSHFSSLRRQIFSENNPEEPPSQDMINGQIWKMRNTHKIIFPNSGEISGEISGKYWRLKISRDQIGVRSLRNSNPDPVQVNFKRNPDPAQVNFKSNLSLFIPNGDRLDLHWAWIWINQTSCGSSTSTFIFNLCLSPGGCSD